MSMELVGNIAVWLSLGVLGVFFFIMIVIIYLVIESIPEIRNEVRSELSTIIKERIRAENEELSNNSPENALEDTAEMSMAEKAEENNITELDGSDKTNSMDSINESQHANTEDEQQEIYTETHTDIPRSIPMIRPVPLVCPNVPPMPRPRHKRQDLLSESTQTLLVEDSKNI
ncbi:hypothetical protein NEAUS04_2296 [Nematocida ausubeli]|nr:hypothetical protein NEAUS04_2296 [Nematocida ausubeli]